MSSIAEYASLYKRAASVILSSSSDGRQSPVHDDERYLEGEGQEGGKHGQEATRGHVALECAQLIPGGRQDVGGRENHEDPAEARLHHTDLAPGHGQGQGGQRGQPHHHGEAVGAHSRRLWSNESTLLITQRHTPKKR